MQIFDIASKIVCKGEGIPVENLAIDTRLEYIRYPRQLVMYFCREHSEGSLAKIGKCVGRNHATVLHACSVIKNYILTDVARRIQIDMYRKQIDRVLKGEKLEDVLAETDPYKERIEELEKRIAELEAVIYKAESKYKDLAPVNGQPYSGYRPHQL